MKIHIKFIKKSIRGSIKIVNISHLIDTYCSVKGLIIRIIAIRRDCFCNLVFLSTHIFNGTFGFTISS